MTDTIDIAAALRGARSALHRAGQQQGGDWYAPERQCIEAALPAAEAVPGLVEGARDAWILLSHYPEIDDGHFIERLGVALAAWDAAQGKPRKDQGQ